MVRKAVLIALITVMAVLFAAVGAWAAGAEYRALTTPEVVSPGEEPTKLGSLHVRVAPLEKGTHSALAALPEGCTVVLPADMHALESEMVLMSFKATEKPNEFLMTVEAMTAASAATFVIPLSAGLAGLEEGDIPLTITGLSGQLGSDVVTVGEVVDARVSVSVAKPPVIGETGSSGGQVSILVTENSPGALNAGAGSLEFLLPAGFFWDAKSLSVEVLKTGGYKLTAAVDGANPRILTVDVVETGKRAQGTVRINADVLVSGVDAPFGDVTATLGGATKADPASLVVARYQDYGAELTARSVPDVLAGRLAAAVGELALTETAPDSLASDRTITLSLPDGAKWASFGSVKGEGGLGVAGTPEIANDGQTLRYSVKQVRDNKVGKISFKDMKVDIAVDFTGDLTVEAGGSAGVTGKVTVAKVLAPVQAQAAQPGVGIGKQDQPAGKITLTEGAAGALLRGKNLLVRFPDRISLEMPKVRVVKGDLDIDVNGVELKDNVLTIPVRTQSTLASTIEISDITYTLDRFAAAGPVVVEVFGPAVNQVNDKAALAGVTRGFKIGADGIFPSAVAAAKVANAIAGGGVPAGDVLFVIGEASYTVQGVKQKMDVAPYLKNGRTYLPLRYVGLSLGVSEEDIEWDGKTATLTKGDTVVKVTVNVKSLNVNGKESAIDAAPELAPPGRIMLPYRAVAEAFGAKVDWDAATKTVTMTL